MKYYVELPEVWVTEFLEDDHDCAGYWISSLTQSWQKGYPDNCTVPWTNYVDLVRRLRLHTDKQIIVDVDMLYNEPSIAATVANELYHVGCNTIVVESKRFPKVNSLIPDSMVLSTPEEFARLINKVKVSVPGLQVIARNEYLATTRDVETTCNIARRTVDAGADGVVVHWGGDDNTGLLKQALANLKTDGIHTGIIPTKYLGQVVAGEFDEIADFSILGNICSSYIRHSFSNQSIDSLLNTPCMFKDLLQRVSGHEPAGQKTLIVLGAREGENGGFLLSDAEVLERFTNLLGKYYAIVFAVGEGAEIPVAETDRVHIVEVEGSVGEVHTLTSAMSALNTEQATVVYADIEGFAFDNLDAAGMLFNDDVYAGVINVKSDALISMVQGADPVASMLGMGLSNQVVSTVIRR